MLIDLIVPGPPSLKHIGPAAGGGLPLTAIRRAELD
jgi:hypothetical protein